MALALPSVSFFVMEVFPSVFFCPSDSLMDSTFAAVPSFTSLFFTALEPCFAALLWNADPVNCDISLKCFIEAFLSENVRRRCFSDLMQTNK